MKRAALFVVAAGLAVAALFPGCGGGQNDTSTFTPDSSVESGSGSGSGGDSGASSTSSSGGSDSGLVGFGDASSGCVPSTCAQLGANCGAATDTKCGGVVQCGTCEAGTCGGGGMPNVCGGSTGGNPDSCTPMTCASQNITCGQASDGCGNTLPCGSCTLPQTCGGNPASPGQCGCTGVCQMIPTCATGTTTTLTGTVMDPAGLHPLYDALVYIPNNPSDPGLQPFPAGITCDVCGATAAGNPLVSTFTAPDGTFTLSNVPVGSSILLVVQLGRWRRQFTVSIPTSCAPNALPAVLTMPQNHTQGDIPRIGILTGGFDPMECVLRKMGVQDSEFTDPTGTGHIQFYLANDPNVPADPFAFSPGSCPPNPYGSGAAISAATPTQDTLFGTTGSQPTINNYDMVILACEGYEENMQADWPNLAAYTGAGGRVFMTDFSYDWLAQTTTCKSSVDCGAGGTCSKGFCTNAGNVTQNPAYPNVAAWHTKQNVSGSQETGTIDLVSNPKGMAFEQWLQIVGASATGSGTVSLNPVFHNSDSVISPTQQWLYWGSMTPIHFTFNTPVGAASANQCGRVVYSDWHADTLGFQGSYPSCPYVLPTAAPYYSHGLTFPTECDTNPMTPQEAILEFMLFDLTACVQPYTPVCTPTSCMSQGIQCGPTSDGCGNLLQCGSCPMGQTCGGGGPGKCGTTMTCMPETCMSQGIQCGQAGDGCGNTISCGSCAAGQICGLNSPGKCGTPAQ